MRIIAVDAMGGDNAPGAIVSGCFRALAAMDGIQIKLFGVERAVKKLLQGQAHLNRLTFIDAPDVIDIHEPPMLAVRKKANSSMVQAMLAVKNGEADAMVSAGPTGAMLAGGILRVGRIEGIERPALTVIFPSPTKPFLLLDCGANVDCQPEYLVKFGLMGSVFMQKVLGVAAPDVRLLNIGAEAEKGNRLAKEAYQLMAAQTVYRFGGNIEARDVPMGACDVVVADGFDGNVLLKYTEGVTGAMVGMLKEQMTSSLRAKAGALLMKPALRAFKRRLSADEYGGAPLLGVKGALVKAHGSANEITIQNAIRQAYQMAESGLSETIAEGVGAISAQSGKEENHV